MLFRSEAYNDSNERGNLLQESGTYAPSSVTSAKFNYEIDIDSGGVQKTSFEKDEFVVGSTTGAIGRIDVIGNSSNLYIEQFSEAQFDIDETITGKSSKMTAKVASFSASPLHAANNLLSYADVDKTSGDFLEYFRRDFMPFIDRDFINDLPNRVDIVGLINKRVALKKAGKDYKACCPFHEEKTPSFTVVPTKQIYHCFGCGESGGVIDFVMKYDHLSFVEAIETVAGESGVSDVYDQTVKPVDKRFKRYNEIMNELNNFYQGQLKTSSAKNKIGRASCRERV